MKFGRFTNGLAGVACLLGTGCGGANDSSGSGYPYTEASGLVVCSADAGDGSIERYDFDGMDQHLKQTPELLEAGQARGLTAVDSCQSARTLNELQQDFVRSQLLQSELVETGDLAISTVDKIYEGVISSAYFPIRLNNGNCSGSLIGKHWALTAAHCAAAGWQNMDVQISTGQYIASPTPPESTGQVRVIRYPGYTDGVVGDLSDIALIYNPAGWLAPANDPSRHIRIFGRRLYTNSSIMIFGYGANNPDYSNDGQQRSTPGLIKVNHDTPEFFSSYVRTGLGRACLGDSGGPAVIFNGYTPILTGVFSWMARNSGACPRSDGEMYYRQAGPASDWIMNQVNAVPGYWFSPADRCIRVQPSGKDYTYLECTH